MLLINYRSSDLFKQASYTIRIIKILLIYTRFLGPLSIRAFWVFELRTVSKFVKIII